MAKKNLTQVIEESGVAPKAKKITVDEAQILSQIAGSAAHGNDRARKALTAYLEAAVDSEVGDEEARAAMSILKQSVTSRQKDLCNQVLDLYLDRFAARAKKEQPVAA